MSLSLIKNILMSFFIDKVLQYDFIVTTVLSKNNYKERYKYGIQRVSG
jgi:hypothetical protein